MKRSGLYLLLFSLPLLVTTLQGQENFTITGQIIDDSLSVPLPFAAISVANSTLGTVSNNDGWFQLSIPPQKQQDTLLATFLGYRTVRVKIPDDGNLPVILRLKPVAFHLSEVEIVGLTPREVIRRAVANIPDNYGKDSLLLTAFIRSQKFVGSKLAEFSEAIVEDLKTGYSLYKKSQTENKFRNSNIPCLLKGRVSSDTSLVNAMGDVGKKAGCLGCNFMNDLVEYYHQTILDENLLKYYDLKMKEIVLPAGGKIYQITYDQLVSNQKLYQGELIIDGTSFAIMKSSQKPSYQAFDAYEKGKFRQSYTIFNIPGWIAEMPLLERTITYSKRGEKWCLSTIREVQWVTFVLPEKARRVRMGYKNDVVITNVTREVELFRTYKGSKSLGADQRWDQIVGQPDPEFWADFNYLPIESELEKSLQRLVQKQ